MKRLKRDSIIRITNQVKSKEFSELANNQAFINDASEYRFGGDENFCSACISITFSSDPSSRPSGNSVILFSSEGERTSNPAKIFFLEDAVNSNFLSFEEIVKDFLSYLELSI